MTFISRDFSLPLFLKSKNPYRNNRISKAVNVHLRNARALYVKNCKTTRPETQHIAECIGVDISTKRPCNIKKTCTFGKRDPGVIKWITPLCYDIEKEPFLSLRGDLGSYWKKLLMTIESPFVRLAPKKRVPRLTPEQIGKPINYYQQQMKCDKIKGKISGNARLRRPTTRCMTTDVTLCYRNPKFPGPTKYYSRSHELNRNVSKVKIAKKMDTYIFLEKSMVPASRLYMYKKNTALSPSSVHYENRFTKINHVAKDCKLLPNLMWDIEKQNRLKFRRLPYKKIKCDAHCLPELRHVKGHGFQHLFKNIPLKKDYKNLTQTTKNLISETQTQLHVDAKYIHMINNPTRNLISKWHVKPGRISEMRFNSVNYKKKKKIRVNKKIAFFSSSNRWKHEKRPRLLTFAQLKKLKMSLPIERQLTNHPVTTRNIEDIESRLYEIPPRFRTDKKVKRKINFKFVQNPGVEHILIDDSFEKYRPIGDRHHVNVEDFLIGNDKVKQLLMTEIRRLSREEEDLLQDVNPLDDFGEEREEDIEEQEEEDEEFNDDGFEENGEEGDSGSCELIVQFH